MQWVYSGGVWGGNVAHYHKSDETDKFHRDDHTESKKEKVVRKRKKMKENEEKKQRENWEAQWGENGIVIHSMNQKYNTSHTI